MSTIDGSIETRGRWMLADVEDGSIKSRGYSLIRHSMPSSIKYHCRKTQSWYGPYKVDESKKITELSMDISGIQLDFIPFCNTKVGQQCLERLISRQIPTSPSFCNESLEKRSGEKTDIARPHTSFG